jgi:hypothetical protein
LPLRKEGKSASTPTKEVAHTVHQFRSFTSHSLAALLEAGIIAFILAALVVAPALAAKGGNGGSGKGPDKAGGYGSSSLELVYLDDSDGNQVPNHGDTVGFVVSTSATDRPFVSLNCYQGNAWVYSASVGYFAAYPWSQQFVLSAASWPEGAASCMARLYLSKDGSRTTTLATLAVAVEE